MTSGGSSPIEEAAAGVTRATIEALSGKASQLIQWVGAYKLRFLGNPQTISETKARKHSSEWEALLPFLATSDLRNQVLIGLELRDLEEKGEVNRLQDARAKLVHSKYGEHGLHVAQLAKLGIVLDLVSELIKRRWNRADIQSELAAILSEAEARVKFVKAEDSAAKVAQAVASRLDAQGTQLLIAKGRARDVLEKALERVPKSRTRVVMDQGPESSQVFAILFREDQWPVEDEDESSESPPTGRRGAKSKKRHKPLLRKR